MTHDRIARIREGLAGTQFEGRAWLVGGVVRDAMLGRKSKGDTDVVVLGDAQEAVAILWKKGVCESEPVTYPRFGTAMVRVEGRPFEFASARKESYESDSRKPRVEPATIEDDAKRRDFTVNALFQDLFTGEVSDPLGTALADLKARVLRTPLDPVETFHDDPLRMLRAVRFRWQLGFKPVEGLYEAIRQEANRLQVISAERIREELEKMLRLVDGHECLADLMDLGLMAEIAPEFCEGVGMEQGPYHDYDVWDHTVEVVGNADPRDMTLRLAAWFHDIAKPQCRVLHDDGKITFHGHEDEGAVMAGEVLTRLTFPTRTIDDVCLLVRHHMRLLGMQELSRTAARRIWRDMGDQTERLVALCEADAEAHSAIAKRLDFDEVRRVLETVAEETPPNRLGSPLDGETIMRLTGLSEGKEIGKIKQRLSDLVVEGHLLPDDIESAEKEVKRMAGNV